MEQVLTGARPFDQPRPLAADQPRSDPYRPASVARIRTRGGALFVPAKTPYERELVFEHVALYVSRHGSVRLDLDRSEWVVTTTSGRSTTCARCDRALAGLTYARGARKLCGGCVRAQLGTGH